MPVSPYPRTARAKPLPKHRLVCRIYEVSVPKSQYDGDLTKWLPPKAKPMSIKALLRERVVVISYRIWSDGR